MAAIDRTNYKKIQRSYYNINIYNDTNDDIECKYSANMIIPLLDKPNQYEVSVVRASVPLDGIPISQVNIGFESWQVQFTNTQTNQTSNAYVQQFNPNNVTYTDNVAFVALNDDYLNTVSIRSPEPSGFAPYALGPYVPLLIRPGYIPNTTVSNIVFSQTYIHYINITSPTIITQYLYNGQSNSQIDISVGIPNVDIRAMCASQLRDELYVVVFNPNSGFLELLTYITPTSSATVSDVGVQYPSATSIISMSCSDTYLSLSTLVVAGDLGQIQIINFDITGSPVALLNQQPPIVENAVIYTYVDSSSNCSSSSRCCC